MDPPSQNSVFLSLYKCTKSIILNPSNPNSPSFALVALTDGSHHSYISEKLVMELGCQLSDMKATQVKCFGHPDPNLMCYRNTVVMCQTRQSIPIKLNLRVIPEIKMPVPYVLYSSFNPKNLSEPTPNMVQVNCPDILIGNNHYYHFNLSPIQTFPSGITLIDSNLGPLLGGAGFVPIPRPIVLPVIPLVKPSIEELDEEPSTSAPTKKPRQPKIHLRLPCHLCSNTSHNAMRCPADIDSRRMLVTIKDWCFLCLKKHGPNSCLRRSLCEICEGFHNEALCPLVFPSKTT